ncbi:MAG: hypothetical protein HGA39_01020 [Coriobacteriia bacterium]|nr:hypothetical protein [Coriobacteriia bacterium]
MTQAAALLDLQAVDLEILRNKKRLDELPEKQAILELRAKQREVMALHARAEVLLGKLQKDLKAHQDEVFMLSEKIKGEQAKVSASTDHRAITSMTREMDGLRRRRDKLEVEAIALMERVEKATGQIGTIDEALEQLKTKDAALVERYKTVGRAAQSEIAALEARRAALASSLPVELAERYEAVRASKGGVGVGRLEAGACSACRMLLPAQRVASLEAGDAIGVCPQCHRMIVVRSDHE